MPGMPPRIKQKKGRLLDNYPNVAPVVTITSSHGPGGLGGSDTFTATAIDAEDGDITASIVWTTSFDTNPNTGTGGSFTTQFLDLGSLTVTATVTDAWGKSGSDTVVVEVS